MKHRLSSLVPAFLCVVSGLMGVGAPAQTATAALQPVAQANRVAAHPDLAPQTQLPGHLPPWVSAGAQVASRRVDLAAPLHLSVVLRRDAAVQAAFTQLLAAQQTPGSPLYHQWLTPQQVGELFGPTASDVAAVSAWLTAQGLTVESVSPSRVILEVSGSTAAVGSALRTSFAYFNLNGTARLSAVSGPFVPTALTPVIESIHGLTDVLVRPLSILGAPRSAGSVPGAPASGSGPSPLYTNTSGTSTSYFLTPNDFATIYDVKNVYSGGDKGATVGSKAQHVAIIGRSRVAATDISEYAANTGIASYSVNTIVPTTGVDPGVVCTFADVKTCSTSGDQGEQTLDVDRVIGTAPGVQADLVVSGSTNSEDGVYIAAAYNVNSLVDPVMTISYGSCEYSDGSAGDNVWDALFSAGAAEGISTFVSSGDSGANACAGDGPATTTVHPASINSICASSYATCVGGTEFNDTASPSTYWSATNGAGMESAISYIPEGGWNDPGSGIYEISASGGGPSLYIAKPTWQTGTGVPADGHRDTPDVALVASPREGFYVCLDFELGEYTGQGITAGDNCTAAGHGYFFAVGGTSASAPSMAGITALLNTKAGFSQGNLNPLLYKVAASTSGAGAFHDLTVATSGVTGCMVTVPSMCNNSTPSPYGNLATLTGGEQGYLLTTGYDEVTGLGSVDVANFLAAAAPGLALTTPAALSFTSGAATGNSTSTTLSSVNSFAGTVALTCTISAGTEVFAPTCSVSPASATLTANGSGTETITISSTTAQAVLAGPVQAGLGGWGLKSAALLAALLLSLALPRRRRALRPLAAFALLAVGLSAVSGCSSSSGAGSGSGGTVHGSSAGSYTVTVTASGTPSGSSTATAVTTTTFALTIH